MGEDYPRERRDDETIEEFRLRQRRYAITLANAQRTRISVMKRAIKTKVIDDQALVRGSLTEYEPLIESWPILRLLKACRSIGDARAYLILDAAEVSPKMRMRELSWAKRAEIAGLIAQARDPASNW